MWPQLSQPKTKLLSLRDADGGRKILMAKIKPKEILERLGERPILTATILFIIIWLLVLGASIIRGKNYKGEFLNSILVEAHGLLFDIIVFGILIVFFNKMGERRRNVQRWQEEIADFRGWDEKEATFRIVGNIKRLNRNGITVINLSDCFLKNAELSHVNLRDANLFISNLEGASLIFANLEGANLNGANLKRANLELANLKGVSLEEVNLEGAILYGADLQEANPNRANFKDADLNSARLSGADFWQANLEGANLFWANLEGTNLEGANLEGASLINANLKGTENLAIEQLSKVKTLYRAKLDPELEKEVKEKYPHLLEKPKEEEEK
jgi:uncharacterized protein YjbI with pentapeptide repeats